MQIFQTALLEMIHDIWVWMDQIGTKIDSNKPLAALGIFAIVVFAVYFVIFVPLVIRAARREFHEH